MRHGKTKDTDGLEDGQKSHIIVMGGNNPEALRRLITSRENAAARQEKIRKATVVDGRTLHVTYMLDTPQGSKETSDKCPGTVHPDLLAAFTKLNDHLGRLCFQPIIEPNPLYTKDNKEVEKNICNIHCVGYVLSGNEDNEAVTLVGFRTLPNAKEIALKSPSQKWDGDIYDYKEIDDLSEAIMECEGEVMLYLFPSDEWPNCKYAPDNQLSLFPDEEEDELTK